MADLSEIAESLVQRDIVKTEELTEARGTYFQEGG